MNLADIAATAPDWQKRYGKRHPRPRQWYVDRRRERRRIQAALAGRQPGRIGRPITRTDDRGQRRREQERVRNALKKAARMIQCSQGESQ